MILATGLFAPGDGTQSDFRRIEASLSINARFYAGVTANNTDPALPWLAPNYSGVVRNIFLAPGGSVAGTVIHSRRDDRFPRTVRPPALRGDLIFDHGD